MSGDERQQQAFQRMLPPWWSWMFDVGYEHYTINSHRSAISAYHPKIGGIKVGQHDLVIRVMDGVFNGRLPQPRYIDTWDVGQVLEHIQGLGENPANT